MADYIIYCYFNGDQVRGVLNAVVMLMGSGGVDGNYLGLVRVAATLGVFLATCYGFLRARGEDAGHYLIMVALFYTTLFIPRVPVTIEDRGLGAGAPTVVANVPIGLAFFASTTSKIGSWLTERTETFFSLPDTSLKLGSNGLMGAARAMRVAQTAAMPDPILAQDMTNFMRDCINPELVVSPVTVNALLTSKNIWQSLGPTGLGLLNPGRMVALAGTGSVQCDVAYSSHLGPRLAPAATSEFARVAKLLAPHAAPATAVTMLTALLPVSESLIMTASASTTVAIQQRMMINMLNDTSANMAVVMNDPSSAQKALGSAIAASNANSAYVVMAKLAHEALPLIRNAIELVVLGIFPIVLILIIVAGSKGGMVLRSYIMTMLWIQLWAPLYAIVNYVGTVAGSKDLKAALDGVDGVAVSNAAALLNSAISAEAIAGMLTISVPMIALAIVKGGEVAMSGVTSNLLGPTQQASTAAGSQVGSGNVSMGNYSSGNASVNNSQGNKSDMSWGYVTPTRGDFKSDFGSGTIRGSAAGTSAQLGNLKSDIGNIGVSGSHGGRVDATRVVDSGERADYSDGTSTGTTQRTTGQITRQEGASALASIQKALESSFGGDHSWLTKEGVAKGTGTGERVGTNTGTSHTSSLELGGRAGVNGGAETSFNNPVDQARNRNNTQAAGHILNGDPYKLQQSGNQGQRSVPVLPSSSVTANKQSSAQQPTMIGAGGSQPIIQSSANPADDGILSKAIQAANTLANAVPKSAYAISGTYGLGTKDAEQQSWSSERLRSTETQQRAERNFDIAAKAIRATIGKDSSTGQAAAVESFLGHMARALDANYQTNIAQRFTRSAGNSSSRTDANGASVQITDNSAYEAEALRLAGGNAERALKLGSTNSDFREQIAAGVGRRIAESVAPRSGSSIGMDGQPIDSPISVSKMRTEGQRAVETQRQADQNTAVTAAKGFIKEANGMRQTLGAPPTIAMPNQSPAQNVFNELSRATTDGHNAGQRNVVRDAGINRLLEAVYADQGGFGRLLGSSLGFGIGTKTHDENMQAIQNLSAHNPSFNQRLESIGRQGRLTEDDKRFFAENRGDGLVDSINNGLNRGVQSAKDLYDRMTK